MVYDLYIIVQWFRFISWTLLACLYESTGRGIAVTTASVLAMQNVKVFG